MYQKDEVAIYQSPVDGHCVVHSVIGGMRDQGLKAMPTTDNLIDMVMDEKKRLKRIYFILHLDYILF